MTEISNIEDPEFLEQDEWRRERDLAFSSGFAQRPKTVVHSIPVPNYEEVSIHGSRSSDGLEHGASTSAVTGSNPVETTILPGPFVPFDDEKDRKIEIYESALREIYSVRRVESSAEQSAEAFFFVAASMRKMAKKALKEAGVEL